MFKPIRFLAVLTALAFLLPGAGHARSKDEQRKKIGEAIKKIREELKAIEKNSKTAFRRGRLHEKIGNLEVDRGRPVVAVKAYRRALDAYASAGTNLRRDRLLSRLSRKRRDWSQDAADIFREIKDAWRQIKRLRYRARMLPRRKQPPKQPGKRIEKYQEQLEEVRKVARQHKYAELQAWVTEVNGRLAAAEGRPEEEPVHYQKAAALCDQEACPGKRKQLLIAAAWTYERLGQLEESFKIYARLNAEALDGRSEKERQYARSRELVRVCRKLLKKSGDVSCWDLERRTVGFVTYWDFSKGRRKPQLSRSDIREVHEEYVPLLSKCLIQAVKTGEAEPGETYQLSWTILNNGQAKNFECWPATEEYDLGTCFKEALTIFRYPRYLGERQNITLPLLVEGTRIDNGD